MGAAVLSFVWTLEHGGATTWGTGNGAGPWIMADMEAGLFSGYDEAKRDYNRASWEYEFGDDGFVGVRGAWRQFH